MLQGAFFVLGFGYLMAGIVNDFVLNLVFRTIRLVTDHLVGNGYSGSSI